MIKAGRQIPVIIVTGFLGSGKTTLLNRLLGDPEFSDSAVLVNEFGAIGLDHKLIATATENIVLLDAGCLCCVMTDSLRETLADLYQRRANGSVPPFSRVLIETTGLADPAPILQSIMKDGVIAPLFKMAGMMCVVDAENGLGELADHREAREQVAMADRLVVTKATAGPDLLARLKGLNPTTEIVSCPPVGHAVADLFALDRIGSLRTTAEGGHDHARHAGNIGSESFRVPTPVSWAGVSAWTGHLRARFGDDLLRCKALLPLAGGGTVLVQGVRRTFEIGRADEVGLPDDKGAVVCIGRGLDREILRQGLAWLEAPEGAALPPTPQFAPWALTMEDI